jgi:hypothetical protein
MYDDRIDAVMGGDEMGPGHSATADRSKICEVGRFAFLIQKVGCDSSPCICNSCRGLQVNVHLHAGKCFSSSAAINRDIPGPSSEFCLLRLDCRSLA